MPGFLKRLPLLLIGLVVALVLGEVLLRAIGYGEVTPGLKFDMNTRAALEQGRFAAHDDLFWTLPPTPGPADRAMNAVHPGRSIRPKGKGRRVLVLGDSCSRLSVSTLPYSGTLQERLFSEGAEVLNASVPGYTTHQGLTWLRLQLLEASPDVTVVYFGWNDHWRATGMTDRAYAESMAPNRPRLLTLLDRRSDVPDFRVPADHYRENLETMIDELRAAGSDVVLVAAPSRFTGEARLRLVQTGYLLPDDDVAEIHARYLDIVRSFAGRDGVSVLSGDRLYDQLGRQIPLLHRDGIHPTDQGHAALGAALAEMIRSGAGADGSIPPRLLTAARLAVDAGSNGGGAQ